MQISLARTSKRKHKKTKNKNMYNIASELYNEFLEIYFDEYIDLSDSKKKKNLNDKYDPTNLILDTYDYSIWFKKE